MPDLGTGPRVVALSACPTGDRSRLGELAGNIGIPAVVSRDMKLLDRFRGRTAPALLCLSDTLDALGDVGHLRDRTTEVPVTAIIGTDGRYRDFDGQFRLCTAELEPRRREVARVMRTVGETPPVRLVQLGELYFVVDGHHRVSVARQLGRETLPAHVHRIQTVAWGEGCVRWDDLPSKAGERRFLERVPLPEPVRCRLWLSEPADWARLADAAEAWGLRRALAGHPPRDRCELADSWWRHEVRPVVERHRATSIGDHRRDVEVYVDALRADDAGQPLVPRPVGRS